MKKNAGYPIAEVAREKERTPEGSLQPHQACSLQYSAFAPIDLWPYCPYCKHHVLVDHATWRCDECLRAFLLPTTDPGASGMTRFEKAAIWLFWTIIVGAFAISIYLVTIGFVRFVENVWGSGA